MPISFFSPPSSIIKNIEPWFVLEFVFITSSNLQFLKPLPGERKDMASSKLVFPVPFFPVKIINLMF